MINNELFLLLTYKWSHPKIIFLWQITKQKIYFKKKIIKYQIVFYCHTDKKKVWLAHIPFEYESANCKVKPSCQDFEHCSPI